MVIERPSLPPFTTADDAALNVRLAEDAWNSRDAERVALAYTPDCQWRNRTEFIESREQIVNFLRRKWAGELDYRLVKELWGFREKTVWLFASPTNGMMTRASGSGRTEMNCGNSMSMESCVDAWRA